MKIADESLEFDSGFVWPLFGNEMRNWKWQIPT